MRVQTTVAVATLAMALGLAVTLAEARPTISPEQGQTVSVSRENDRHLGGIQQLATDTRPVQRLAARAGKGKGGYGPGNGTGNGGTGPGDGTGNGRKAGTCPKS